MTVADRPEAAPTEKFLAATDPQGRVAAYLRDLEVRGASVATRRSYRSDLQQLLVWLDGRGGSLVGLDFDAGDRAWPIYNWMGVCKAALRSVSKYVARDLGAAGIRSNLVAAGPLSTRAALGIPNFSLLTEAWDTTSPLAWSSTDASPVADVVCFLLSDFARAITGELLHVDGGYHAMARTRSEQGGSAGL